MKFAMRKLSIIMLLFIACTIYYLWKHQSSIGDERREVLKTPYISKPIKIDENGDYVFNINKSTWPEIGSTSNELLILSMVFANNSNVSFDAYRTTKLFIKIFVTGVSRKGEYNRLVLNDVCRSNEILLLNAPNYGFNMAIEGNHYFKEYYLGFINNFIGEELIVKIKIVNPDATLNLAKPRLFINGYLATTYDYRGTYFQNLLSLIFMIAAMSMIIIFIASHFIKYKDVFDSVGSDKK